MLQSLIGVTCGRLRHRQARTSTGTRKALRPMMKQMFDHMGDVYGLVGNCQCVSMDFASTGMRYAGYFPCKDPQKLFDAYRQFMPTALGFAVEEIPAREIAGLKVAGMQIKIDFAELSKKMGAPAGAKGGQEKMDAMMERMFGKGGMKLQVASKDGLTAIVMGAKSLTGS